MNEYFPISIKYKNEQVYAIWYTAKTEGLVCKSGKIVCFCSLDALSRYAAAEGLSISKALHKSYDLDALSDYIRDDDRYADGSTLDYWSLFADISSSIKKPFAGDGNSFILNDIYEKLCMAGIDFDGIADDDTGDRFDLTPEEESLTKAVLKTGIELYLQGRIICED